MFFSKLKIGLDYHGVIDTDPSFFAEFSTIAHLKGHLIYVISGAPQVAVRYELSRHNFPVDFIFSILDYCLALGEIVQSSSYVKIADDAWNKAKAEFCLNNHIDLHIDDNQRYFNYFTTSCCLYQADDRLCRLTDNLKIDFNLAPDQALLQLEQLCKRTFI